MIAAVELLGETEMKFDQPASKTKAELLTQIETGDGEQICTALISAGLYEPDRPWVESLVVRMIQNEDPMIRAAAALAAAHVARLHKAISKDIPPLIERLLDDPLTRGKALDALDDIRIFVGAPRLT